ncbi:MAG: AmmeMemoRadiSam system radical SAM enzyme [Candidatus Riflebacteria bacterium]|nr:AmmeMemoRadiSam system radical SAM enzyme [Candidatus Riflebacteria bacterium]
MKHAAFAVNGPETSDCSLCPNACRIAEGHRGRCRGRGRKNGNLVVHNYGVIVSAHMDPIEKKPLYHFYPGRSILSVGSYGCNLSCRFCQNCEISQHEVNGEFIPPQKLAQSASTIPENLGVAFTYNEPGISYEYILESAPLIHNLGLKVVLVTNGYLSDAPWRNLCGCTDAMNIDLKGFTDEFYANICGGKLAPVLKNIQSAHEAGVHLELTNLIVPELNDDPGYFEEMITWIASLSTEIPLHLSRYFPHYKENAPPTSPELLEDFRVRAARKLKNVFIGNVSPTEANNSCCPDCGQIWVERHGYSVHIKSPGTTCTCGRRKSVHGI